MPDAFAIMKQQLRKDIKSEKIHNEKEQSIVNKNDNVVIEELSTEEDIQKATEELEELSNFADNEYPKLNNRRNYKEVPLLDYLFTPRESITIYELARLLSYIKMSISQDVYDNMPIELKQHFTKCVDEN